MEETSTQTTMTQQSEGQPEHSGVLEWEQALEFQRQILPYAQLWGGPFSLVSSSVNWRQEFLYPSRGCFKDLKFRYDFKHLLYCLIVCPQWQLLLLQDAKMKKPVLGRREQVRLIEKAMVKLTARFKIRITPKSSPSWPLTQSNGSEAESC